MHLENQGSISSTILLYSISSQSQDFDKPEVLNVKSQ